MNHRAPWELFIPSSHQPWPVSRISKLTNGARPRHVQKPREKPSLQALNGRKNRQTSDRPLSTVLSSPRIPSPPSFPKAGPLFIPSSSSILACRFAISDGTVAWWHGAPRSFWVLSISRTLEEACWTTADMIPLQTVPGAGYKGRYPPRSLVASLSLGEGHTRTVT